MSRRRWDKAAVYGGRKRGEAIKRPHPDPRLNEGGLKNFGPGEWERVKCLIRGLGRWVQRRGKTNWGEKKEKKRGSWPLPPKKSRLPSPPPSFTRDLRLSFGVPTPAVGGVHAA